MKNTLKQDFPLSWRAFVLDTATQWQKWVDINLRHSAKQIPTYIVRYEDLIMEPEKTISGVMCLLLNAPTIEGTVCEKLVERSCQGGYKKQVSYALKEESGKFNRHVSKYSDETIQEVIKICSKGLYQFGYVESEQEPNNSTGFVTTNQVGENSESCK